MGNTCKPMAVSFQCMTKSTTNKKKIKIKSKKVKKKKEKTKNYLGNWIISLEREWCLFFVIPNLTLLEEGVSFPFVCVNAHSVISILSEAVDCSPPGSSVHGILHARILDCVTMPSSKESSPAKDRTCISCVSCTAGRFFTAEPLGKPVSSFTWTNWQVP